MGRWSVATEFIPDSAWCLSSFPYQSLFFALWLEAEALESAVWSLGRSAASGHDPSSDLGDEATQGV